MSKPKNVQISIELWQALWDYHIRGNRSQDASDGIQEALRAKAQAMRRHAAYTLATTGMEGAWDEYQEACLDKQKTPM